jgi:hypothetical protein
MGEKEEATIGCGRVVAKSAGIDDEIVVLADDNSLWILIEGSEPPWIRLPTLSQD